MNISGTLVGDGHPVFIIAEIGQNHQGSLEIAKQMILKAKELGVDCVKFQKSCLQAKFTDKALERPYTGSSSWGTTYGEHKRYLEFSIDEYRTLQQFCSEIGILFSASAMDPVSLQQLIQLKVPFVKIGSGDADNVPMLRQAALAAVDIPLIVSTGMQSWDQVQQIHQILRGKSTVLLHCVSAYPTPPEDVCLNLIPLYREHFPEFTIGYSGHELGLQITVASVLLGARIVERHFTLNKDWKGTDHKASLNPAEFGRLVKYIRAVQNVGCDRADVLEILSKMLPEDDFNREELTRALKPVTVDDRKLMTSEITCHRKLGKSLVFGNDIEPGHVLEWTDVAVKVSEPRGLPPTWFDRIVGTTVIHTHKIDEPILADDLVPE